MITVFISVLNEEKYLSDTIETVIEAAMSTGNIALDIIINNDGSTDRTAEIITRLEKKYGFVRSIHHSKNVGIGIGFKEAVKIAKYPKFTIIPGDNDISLDSIKLIFRNIDKAELIIFYPINKEIRGWFRNVVSAIFGLIYMSTFNTFIEYVNCTCIYPTEKIRSFDLKSPRFSIVTEVLIKSLRSGCTFIELPGRCQTGSRDCRTVSLKNFAEVISVYFSLVYEIYFEKRKLFNKTHVRVY